MTADSRSHLTAGLQRRLIRITIVVAAVLLLVMAPLIVNADLRFDLAHRFGLIPDIGVESLDYESETTELIVIPTIIERSGTVPEVRFRASFLAETLPAGVRLIDLDDYSTIDLPLSTFDLVSASPDGSTVLFRDGTNPATSDNIVLDANTNAVTPLPAGQTAPSDDAWWDEPIWATAPNQCNAVSPGGSLIACYQRPASRYLVGDWQISVQRYGNPKASLEVYRGQGLRPIIGWSGNDEWLYFQNERIIGRVRITPEGVIAA